MVTLGRTLCMSGLRRTSPSDTVVIPWIVESTVTAGVLGERVDWQVTANGLAWLSRPALSRGMVQPNFSDQPSMLPGVTSGMASVAGYGMLLACGAYPAGTLVVDAVATGHDGTTKVLQSITVYNDIDGIDRRPSTKTIYVDAQLGNDANSGADWANAVQTMDRAIYLCQANPGGTSAADRDCGGAQIRARGNFVGGGGGASFPWHCSGEWWLHILCEPGTTWTRINAPWFSDPDDLVCMRGDGAGTTPRLRVTGCNFIGAGPVGSVGSGVLARVWVDGGKSGSANYVADGKVSVRWADDANSLWSFYGPTTADQDAGRVFVTSHKREGVLYGFGQDNLTFDCEVSGFLMNAFWVVGPQKANCLVACSAHLQRYAQGPGQVEGWVRHIGGPGFEVQVPSPGVMRVLGPVGGYDFGRDAAGIGSSPRWGVGCYGFASAANNSGTPAGASYTTTNGAFRLLGTGTIGGRSYVDLDNPSAVAELGIVGSQLETSERAPWATTGPSGVTSPYNQVVHTNGVSLGPERTGDDIVRSCAIYDATGLASDIFTNGADHTRLMLDNVRGPGNGRQILCANSNITQSLIRNVSFNGPLLISHYTPGETPALDFTGLEIVNSVFGSLGSASPEITGLGATVDSCHIMTGSTMGTNATTGTWLDVAGSPLSAPWSWAPAPSRYGTGNSLVPEPVPWAWSPSAPTRGAFKNTCLLTWATSGGPPGGLEVTAAPVEIALQTVAPTVVLGPVSVTAAPSELSLQTVDPEVVTGSVFMQAEASVLVVDSADPVVVLGPVSTTPAASTITFDVQNVSVLKGPTTRTPVLSTLSLATVNSPTVVVGEVPQAQAPTTRPTSSRKLWIRAPRNRVPYRS